MNSTPLVVDLRDASEVCHGLTCIDPVNTRERVYGRCINNNLSTRVGLRRGRTRGTDRQRSRASVAPRAFEPFHSHNNQSKTLSPVLNASHVAAPNAYTPAVMNSTARQDPVLSRITPVMYVPTIPANDPAVLAIPCSAPT